MQSWTGKRYSLADGEVLPSHPFQVRVGSQALGQPEGEQQVGQQEWRQVVDCQGLLVAVFGDLPGKAIRSFL